MFAMVVVRDFSTSRRSLITIVTKPPGWHIRLADRSTILISRVNQIDGKLSHELCAYRFDKVIFFVLFVHGSTRYFAPHQKRKHLLGWLLDVCVPLLRTNNLRGGAFCARKGNAPFDSEFLSKECFVLRARCV